MQEVITKTVEFPSAEATDVLTEILREGAQTLLVQAVEAEVGEWIDRHAHLKDEKGHQQVVRNGRLPDRKITTATREEGVSASCATSRREKRESRR